MPVNITPIQTDAKQTAIYLGVEPGEFIADQVCPRISAPAPYFSYTEAVTGERLRIPETHIGRTGRANQHEHTGTLTYARVEDHALEYPIPESDVRANRALNTPVDIESQGTRANARAMMLAREVRVKNLLEDTSNYESALASTLSGNSQWNDRTNSNPVDKILEVCDKMIVKPNTLVLGQKVWRMLRTHPKVVEAITMSGAGGVNAQGVAARRAVADLFELKNIFVGSLFYNSANEGQSDSIGQMWGKHAMLLHIDTLSTSTAEMQPTFCFTATWGGPKVSSYFIPSRGVTGCLIMRAAEQLVEKVAWKGAGAIFKNAVA